MPRLSTVPRNEAAMGGRRNGDDEQDRVQDHVRPFPLSRTLRRRRTFLCEDAAARTGWPLPSVGAERRPVAAAHRRGGGPAWPLGRGRDCTRWQNRERRASRTDRQSGGRGVGAGGRRGRGRRGDDPSARGSLLALHHLPRVAGDGPLGRVRGSPAGATGRRPAKGPSRGSRRGESIAERVRCASLRREAETNLDASRRSRSLSISSRRILRGEEKRVGGRGRHRPSRG